MSARVFMPCKIGPLRIFQGEIFTIPSVCSGRHGSIFPKKTLDALFQPFKVSIPRILQAAGKSYIMFVLTQKTWYKKNYSLTQYCVVTFTITPD